jgi:hypothetical protein
MGADFSIWAFTAAESSVDSWLSIIRQLPSVLDERRFRSSNGNAAFHLTFSDNNGDVSFVNVHPPSQLWILETSSVYAPVFHWLLRYSEAVCIPRPNHRDTCSRPMVAWEVSASTIEYARSPSMVRAIVLASSQSDLAMTTYEIRDDDRCSRSTTEFWAKTGGNTYLVFAEEELVTRQRAESASALNGRRVRDFCACSDMPCDIKFDDIWKYR